ncbi:MAG TPA: anthranilate phosphoribosyltransferase [Vicinamibacterales bacterium]|jgi:anthranilate phosphoribosyltransferase|nr:anthranilate phosphoribosyltransferase [Vicinamibacterales bacterium]|tara:strand:- start:23999 stop:25021 length:1023 start_codon:yes stop_codon:yes gene_type:complete
MFSRVLNKLLKHHDLSEEEAAEAMAEIMAGNAAASQIGALLIGLAIKGERPNEIVGLARTMRANAVQLTKPRSNVFDTCGTGGDQSNTFNVSSVAALVIAGCEVTVAKHGNRSVSSRCGSADLFEALGVNVAASPLQVERCLDGAGIAFFFAPTFHPSMKHAGPTRKDLGVRTAFNLLGPLTNPAGATRQLVGVPRPEHTELVARAFALLGSEHAWVVHGADGLDEISTTGYTKVSECRNGVVNTFYVHPAEHGISRADMAELKGGSADDNAAIALSVLKGAKGAPRDVVVLNAGAALLVAGRVKNLRDGVTRASESLDSGLASRKLKMMVEFSHQSVEG